MPKQDLFQDMYHSLDGDQSPLSPPQERAPPQTWSSTVTRRIRAIVDRSTYHIRPEERRFGPDYSREIESCDYQPTESVAFHHKVWESNESAQRRRNIARWILTGVVAGGTAVIACVIVIAMEYTLNTKFLLMTKLASSDRLFAAAMLFVSVNLLLALVGAASVVWLEPLATGSGVPEVRCLLNGAKLPRVVRIKTLIVKMVGLVCAVSASLPAGKEGPMIHMGAVIGAGLSQGKSSTFGFDTSFSKFAFFRNDHEKRDFISVGAAAGVATAFNAPIGGVLFNLEGGATFWHLGLTWRAFFGGTMGSFTIATLLSLFNAHSSGLLGLFTFGDFSPQFDPDTPFFLHEVPIFILLGICGGLLGALFNMVNRRLTQFRIQYVRSKTSRFLEVIVITTVVSVVSIAVPFLTARSEFCEPLPADVNETPYVRLNCPEGEFSEEATLWLSPTSVAIKQLYHAEHRFGLDTLLVLAVSYTALSCWMYGSALPSGLFVPMLYAGAAWGRAFGVLVAMTGISNIDPGIFSLMGSAAMLGGTVRLTISLCVILIEATGNLEFGLPLMVTLMSAKFMGDQFNIGIYNIHTKLNKYPFLWEHTPPDHKFLLVRHVMATPVHCVERVVKVDHVHHLLSETTHHAFPVIDAGPDGTQHLLKGLILRKHLAVLLDRKVFLQKTEQADELSEQHLSWHEIEKSYPRFPTIFSISLSDQERELFLDCRPYMHATPFTISETAPLPQAYSLFRSLGLRHLIAVDQNNQVVGVITRKDLVDEHVQLKLREAFEPAVVERHRYQFSHTTPHSYVRDLLRRPHKQPHAAAAESPYYSQLSSPRSSPPSYWQSFVGWWRSVRVPLPSRHMFMPLASREAPVYINDSIELDPAYVPPPFPTTPSSSSVPAPLDTVTAAVSMSPLTITAASRHVSIDVDADSGSDTAEEKDSD